MESMLFLDRRSVTNGARPTRSSNRYRDRLCWRRGSVAAFALLRWSRIFRMTRGSVMNAMTRIEPPPCCAKTRSPGVACCRGKNTPEWMVTSQSNRGFP